jgi:uncharacterized protein (DUF736 family)
MPEYDNTNRGVLFPNDKEGNDKRPDFTGTVNVDGRELRLAAWAAESKTGTKYLQLRVSEKDNGAAKSAPAKSDFDF